VDKDYLFDFDEVKSHLRGTIIRTQKKKKKKKGFSYQSDSREFILC
jgi:hypothetical protein